MARRDTESQRMLREVHEAIVGTPDGRVKGLRQKVDAIEDRHKVLDEGRKLRQIVGVVKHSTTALAGALGGWFAAHK